MRSSSSQIILIFLLFFVAVNDGFLPRRNKIHRGHLPSPKRYDRWCTQDIDCGRGFCRAYTCQCYRGYTTWHFMEVCAYELRLKLTAFLVSFFVGYFGVDWFVLSRGVAGYIVVGIVKLLLSLGCLIGWPIAIATARKQKGTRAIAFGNVINVILTVISFIWWLTDWIRILADVFYDGHGAPLQSWYYTYYDRNPNDWSNFSY